ncbi:MAG: MFS transporter [Proteobacteria bacterium]|nr:MFS transporter [Pseudomonadota bacterium]
MTTKNEGLTKSTIISYGLPRFGAAIIFLCVAVYLPKFYTDTLMLAPALIGWTFLIGRFWDAFTDPLMGIVSDRTQFKMGRRRPYFIVAALPLAVCYYLLWSPPEALSGWWLFVYLTATYLATYTFFTIFAIPYEALAPELTLDHHERTVLTGTREAFAMLGTILATVAPPIAIAMLANPRRGYSLVAAVTSLITFVLILICFFRIRENPEVQKKPSVETLKGIGVVFGNRPFRILIGTLMMAAIGGAFVPILTLYVGDYLIKAPKVAVVVILSYLLAAAVSIVFWTRLSHRIGKKKTLSYTMLISAIGYGITIYYHEGTWILWILMAITVGSAYGGMMALAPSMFADIIDFDELKTGDRREGVYYGFWLFIQKAAIGVVAFVGLQTLQWAGYIPNIEQTPRVLLAIKFLYCILPTICFVVAFILLRRYPIDQKEHHRIRTAIDAKKIDPAADPGATAVESA